MARRTFKGLAALSLALSGGAGTAQAHVIARSTEDLPIELVGAVLDDSDRFGADPASRRELVQLLLTDSRPQVRALAVDFTATQADLGSAVWVDNLLHELAKDPSESVRKQAGHALGLRLGRLSSLVAESCAMAWIVSPNERDRECLARALAATTRFAWDVHIVERLLTDGSAVVRRAAVSALGPRFNAAPAEYGWLLSDALMDEDARVRKLARRVSDGRAV